MKKNKYNLKFLSIKQYSSLYHFYYSLSKQSKINFRPLFFDGQIFIRIIFSLLLILSTFDIPKKILLYFPFGCHLTLYVENENNDILGICYIWKKYFNNWYFGIAISDEYREMGIGTALLNKMIKLSKYYNIKKIYLKVDVSNYTAINFYKKNKFVTIYKNNDYYHMLLNLNDGEV